MDTRMVERLRKVLAMTTSPVEAEAHTAATLLQKLLTEHNLSMADLEKKGASKPGMREQPHDLGKAAFKWKLDLAEGIAQFYYCAPIVDRSTKTVQFVGRPDNVEALVMLYGWVIDQIKAIATVERRAHFDNTGEHIDPLRWQLGFGEGAVVRLIERLREMKARQEEDMARDEFGDIVALTIHHQSEVSDYLEEKYGYRTDGKKTKREMDWDKEWKEWQDRQAAARAVHDALKMKCEAEGDMTPFYDEYPDEHPDQLAARERELERERKELERKQRRRAARFSTSTYRPGKKVDYDKLDQQRTARRTGKQAANRINLQPFLTGSVANDPNKRVN